MNAVSDTAAQAAIGAAARELKLPTVRAEAARLAGIAARERHTHLAYLAEVLSAELDDRSGRRRARRASSASPTSALTPCPPSPPPTSPSSPPVSRSKWPRTSSRKASRS
jgi:hypothetical protein